MPNRITNQLGFAALPLLVVVAGLMGILVGTVSVVQRETRLQSEAAELRSEDGKVEITTPSQAVDAGCTGSNCGSKLVYIPIIARNNSSNYDIYINSKTVSKPESIAGITHATNVLVNKNRSKTFYLRFQMAGNWEAEEQCAEIEFWYNPPMGGGTRVGAAAICAAGTPAPTATPTPAQPTATLTPEPEASPTTTPTPPPTTPTATLTPSPTPAVCDASFTEETDISRDCGEIQFPNSPAPAWSEIILDWRQNSPKTITVRWNVLSPTELPALRGFRVQLWYEYINEEGILQKGVLAGVDQIIQTDLPEATSITIEQSQMDAGEVIMIDAAIFNKGLSVNFFARVYAAYLINEEQCTYCNSMVESPTETIIPPVTPTTTPTLTPTPTGTISPSPTPTATPIPLQSCPPSDNKPPATCVPRELTLDQTRTDSLNVTVDWSPPSPACSFDRYILDVIDTSNDNIVCRRDSIDPTLNTATCTIMNGAAPLQPNNTYRVNLRTANIGDGCWADAAASTTFTLPAQPGTISGTVTIINPGNIPFGPENLRNVCVVDMDMADPGREYRCGALIELPTTVGIHPFSLTQWRDGSPMKDGTNVKIGARFQFGGKDYLDPPTSDVRRGGRQATIPASGLEFTIDIPAPGTCSGITYTLNPLSPVPQSTDITVDISRRGASSCSGDWNNVSLLLDGNPIDNLQLVGTDGYRATINSGAPGEHILQFTVNDHSCRCDEHRFTTVIPQGPTPTPEQQRQNLVNADVNADGAFNALDYDLVVRDYNPIQLVAPTESCDINRDGRCNGNDLSLVIYCLAHQDECHATLPTVTSTIAPLE